MLKGVLCWLFIGYLCSRGYHNCLHCCVGLLLGSTGCLSLNWLLKTLIYQFFLLQVLYYCLTNRCMLISMIDGMAGAMNGKKNRTNACILSLNILSICIFMTVVIIFHLVLSFVLSFVYVGYLGVDVWWTVGISNLLSCGSRVPANHSLYISGWDKSHYKPQLWSRGWSMARLMERFLLCS